MTTIVIDPGHGGWQTIKNDSSWNNAVGPNGTLEKNLTLSVALQTSAMLLKMGHNVNFTRSSDVNLRLKDRAAVAKKIKASVFVSIHFNASDGHNAQGTETLVHSNYSSKSAKLSLSVQDAVLLATKLADRNKAFDSVTRIKPQSLGVLNPSAHHADTASCLLEVCFLDRADEEAKLASASYISDIAKALAQGIVAFAGQKTKKPLGSIAANYGDAVEVAASNSKANASIVKFLGLDKPASTTGAPATKNTKDAKEKTKMPAKAFSPAFVGGTESANFLIKNEAAWAELQDFVKFMESLKLEHFEPDEFLFLGASNESGSCKNLNTFPPKGLWKNIAKTAVFIDAIRSKIGAPIRILSCYRSQGYNSCVGGESGSYHMQFNAIDFTCGAGTPEIWRRIASELRGSNAQFLGGIGLYNKKNFLHVDTRGHEENWVGK